MLEKFVDVAPHGLSIGASAYVSIRVNGNTLSSQKVTSATGTYRVTLPDDATQFTAEVSEYANGTFNFWGYSANLVKISDEGPRCTFGFYEPHVTSCLVEPIFRP